MKRFVSMFCVVWISVSSSAQKQVEKFILPISTDKTTSLIFPFAIRHVDRGTKDVLVQQVTEAANLLLVKAATINFRETNLSIITADGQVYSFEVKYDDYPTQTVYHLVPHIPANNADISFDEELMNARNIESYATGILDNPKFIRGIKDNSWDILTRISGIYIKDKVIFYQLILDNQSPIDYDIDFIRFYIKDKKKGKRTAAQELEQPVLYKTGNSTKVNANNKSLLVFALEKFTVPDAKYFFIEIGEKNGGRHLRLRVNNNKLLKARVLPSYH